MRDDRGLRAARDWLAMRLGVAVESQAVPGGSAASGWRLRGSQGGEYFVKTSPDAPATMFVAEAAGLAALRQGSGLRVPEVLHAAHGFLILEFIEAAPPAGASWSDLGERLADMHRRPAPCFGFAADNFCGASPQPNVQCRDGHQFFVDHRLRYQAGRAQRCKLLTADDLRRLDRLCAALPELVPAHGPALLHGDLWSGNVLFDQAGDAVLIDPACYWGWPEAEIAMSALFGGFAPAFYDAWAAVYEPLPGWRERLPVYQTYHLLNHLVLFGVGYLAQLRSVLHTFT